MSSERAVIFGQEADLYDRFRPSYPSEAIRHIRSLTEVERALEIGAGTGKATVDMADGSVDITCIEPSAGMAQRLSARNLPGVEVVAATFEDFDAPSGHFDLIYAAQSWHWVNPEIAYEHALDILRPQGAIALIWNVLEDRYVQFAHHFRVHAPQLIADMDERIRKRDTHSWSDDLERAGFQSVERWTSRWSTSLGADDYVGLCASYSDHMLLPQRNRDALLSAIAEEIGGDEVALEYRTEVFSGQAPDA